MRQVTLFTHGSVGWIKHMTEESNMSESKFETFPTVTDESVSKPILKLGARMGVVCTGLEGSA